MSPKATRFIEIGLVTLAACLLISCGKQDSGSSSSVTPTDSGSPTPSSPSPSPSPPPVVPSISYSTTTFNERLTNDGSLEGTISIEISNDTFAADVVSGVKYEIRNTPGGLTANLQYVSNTTLKLSFTGQASSHTAADSLANVTIEFKDGAFVNSATASSVTNYQHETIEISYTDSTPSYYLLYSSLEFNEAAANDGSTPGSVIITLNDDGVPDTFTADVTSHVSVGNVPAGLSANFTRDSDTQVTLTLTGTAAAHGDSDDISNLLIEFTDDAFTTQSASNVSDASKNLSVYFFDVALSYSGTQFNEAAANNGSIDNSLTITLAGDTYSAGVTSFVDVTNVPAGLSASLTRNSDTLLTVSLTGTATAHANSNDISNLGITFNAGAFSNASPANVTDSSRSDVSVNFDDTFGSLSYSSSVFNEAAANNGSISSFIDITLSGDIFEADAASHVNASNLPVGISAMFTRQSDTVMRCQLTGNATSHSSSDDISNLGITFTNDAFRDALAVNVTGYTRSNLSIDFIDVFLAYSTTEFTEAGSNDGSISNAITITLTGDTYSAGVTGVVDVTNVPAGLSASLTRNSDTLLTVSLTGTATAHANSNDISNLGITFNAGAFSNAAPGNVTDSSRSDVSVNFNDTFGSLSYSSSVFNEAAANDGSISGTIDITLSGDIFESDAANHVSASNLPAGLSAVFTRQSDTVIRCQLTGTASNHSNGDDIANMGITFTDDAFTNALATNVTGYTRSDLVIDFFDVSLAYSTTEFTEAGANDGSISNAITITLTGDTYSAGVTGFVDVTNVPAGLSASLTRNSGTLLTVSLTGTATAHANSNDISNLGVTFNAGAFSNAAPANVTNSSRSDLNVNFHDSTTFLTYSSTVFNEATANNGTISNYIDITLAGDIFETDAANHVSASNLPAGISASFTRQSDTVMRCQLTGTASSHSNADDISNMGITFTDDAFTVALAVNVTGYTRSDLVIDFFDVSLAYSTTEFTEAGSNDGSISNAITITLTGDTYSAGVTSLVDVTNVPAGLSASLTRNSDTLLTVNLTGNATAHANSNDISNLSISFNAGAFTNTAPANVTNSSRSDLSVNFDDTFGSLNYSGSVFNEAAANDGSIDNSLTITLTGDTYSAGVTSFISVTNVPAGLSASLTRNSDTLVTVGLTGNATAHANSNDISNLGITFNAGAFSNAIPANVTNSSRSDLSVDFDDTFGSLSYSVSTFYEAVANDGSIDNSIEITLTGDTYSASVTSFISVTNVPAGLSASLTRNSDTLVTVGLTGNATAHANSNDISNLGITFNAGAFSNAIPANVTNSSRSDLSVDFDDTFGTLAYSSTVFSEVAANDGSISGYIDITLTGDIFESDAASHVSASNVPAGLSASFTRQSDTVMRCQLSGSATSHTNSDDISNMGITFTDDAFQNALATNVTGYTRSDLTVDFFDVSLSYSTTEFTEAGANDGSIDNSISITLTGDTYSAGVTSFISVTNVPAGLSASLTRNSDTLVTVGLTGNATAHANSNDISNLGITFNAGAFSNAAPANVTDSSRSDLSVNFDDTFGSLAYSSTVFSEAAANDGSISGYIDITLTGDIFESDAASHVSASNVPAGLSAGFTRQSNTVMRCQLTGTASNHSNSDDISNLGITFTDDAFTNALATNVTNSNKSDLAVDFFDIALTYSTTEFTEAGANNGSTSTAIEITLTNDTFPADVVSYISTNNVPAGMSANLVRNSSTMVTFTLTGNAAAHTDADDVSNLTIDFGDNAFTNANAINVDDALVTDLSVNFIDVYLAYNGLAFTETLNDGAVSGSTEMTLSGDTFAADVGDHIDISGVPGGLTASFTRNSDTLVTLEFTGQATSHQNVNDVSNITITFMDEAFANATAATVDNSSQAGLSIDFDDNPILSYSGSEFSENIGNDGSITNSITIDLTSDTFVADVVTNASILVSNIPSGLAVSFIRNSDTQLAFTLTGNASPHEISDSISNLTIEFLEHAFVTSSYAPAVVGYTRNDLQVSFMDTVTVLYSASQLNESDENDGSFTETLVMTIVGDTFSANVVSSSLVQAFNLPVGLSAGFTRDSDTQVTMTLSGNASDHEKVDNVTDVTVAFQDGAFVIKGEALDVTDSTKPDLKLNFYSSITDISMDYHTCAVLASGDVKCWGSINDNGEHGRGDTVTTIGSTPGTMGENLGSALLGTGRTAQSVHVGYLGTCAILDTNDVKCWGINGEGALGLGDTEDRDTVAEMGDNLPAVDLGTGRTVLSLAHSEYDKCALLDTNEVQCWGSNMWGAIGLGNDTDRIGDSPTDMGDNLNRLDLGDVSTVTSLSSISGDAWHFCAILTNGDLKCWGYNGYGSLGLGDELHRGDDPNEMGNNLPVVDLGSGLSSISVDVGEYNTCAILNDDSVKCWGDNLNGQLGLGDTDSRGDGANEMGDNLPAIDLGLDASLNPHTVKAISAGSATCAILNDDRLKCWGWNDQGQLGLGTVDYPDDSLGDEPGEMGDNLGYINLGTGRTVKKVISNGWSICAILDNDRLKCWGYNTFGELGLEDTEHRGDDPGEMGDNLPFVDL